MAKTCTKCKIEKDVSQFGKDSSTKDQLKVRCKECRSADNLAWSKANPEKVKTHGTNWYKNNRVSIKNRTLKQKYGVSLEDYGVLLKSQNNVCAACKQPESATDSRLGETRSLAVDHNHLTHKVRGLLCTGCNAALGFLKEDPIRMELLADYIRGHNEN